MVYNNNSDGYNSTSQPAGQATPATYAYNYKRITLVLKEKQAKLIDEAYQKYVEGNGCMNQTVWLKQIIFDALGVK